MRPAGSGLVVCLAWSAAAASCGGDGRADAGDPGRPRGGALAVTRTHVAGVVPADGLTGIAAFFEPPGPAVSPVPEIGTCTWSTPSAATPAPTASPPVTWNDAGETLTLRSTSAALGLDRFQGPAGEILYLTRPDVQPDAFAQGAVYDLELAGSTATGGLVSGTIGDALAVPPAVALYAPSFTVVPFPLPRRPLQVGWAPGAGDRPAMVRMTVSGSGGSATLVCATEDDGFYEIAAEWIDAFPSGGGTLTVSRSARRETKLASGRWLVADGTLTDGGTILLP